VCRGLAYVPSAVTCKESTAALSKEPVSECDDNTPPAQQVHGFYSHLTVRASETKTARKLNRAKMCFGSRKTDEEGQNRSRELDKIIRQDEKRMAREVKLLLLGMLLHPVAFFCSDWIMSQPQKKKKKSKVTAAAY
jgi:hypothetical protein